MKDKSTDILKSVKTPQFTVKLRFLFVILTCEAKSDKEIKMKKKQTFEYGRDKMNERKS